MEFKYKKYKAKYLQLKNDQYVGIGGSASTTDVSSANTVDQSVKDGGRTGNPNWLPFAHGIMLKESSIGGTGVFATKDFAVGDIVEKCPIIQIPRQASKGTGLKDYVFAGQNGNSNVVLGYGMMYNHSNSPNVTYTEDEDGAFVFRATKEIKANEEIYDSYGSGWWITRGITPN